MDNPEKTAETMKNGQSRVNRRGNEEWTIQRQWQNWPQDRGQTKHTHKEKEK